MVYDFRFWMKFRIVSFRRPGCIIYSYVILTEFLSVKIHSIPKNQPIDFLSVLKFFTQVLALWRGKLSASFTVKQFVQEITLWQRKGFVEPAIWTHLESSLQPHLIPSSMNIYLLRYYVKNENLGPLIVFYVIGLTAFPKNEPSKFIQFYQ